MTRTPPTTGPPEGTCTPERALQIDDLAGGRLGADAALELLEHLEGCPPCSARLDVVADVVALAEAPGSTLARGAGEARGRLLRFLAGGAATLAAAAVVALVLLVPRTEDPAADVRALARLDPPPAVVSTVRGGADTAARDAALEHYEEGDWERAVVALTAVASDRPEDALVWFYLGVARLQLGADDAALTALMGASELAEGLLQERALWYLANAHLARGEGRAAREVLARLVELDGDYAPNARDVLGRLAELYRASPDARSLLDELHELDELAAPPTDG